MNTFKINKDTTEKDIDLWLKENFNKKAFAMNWTNNDYTKMCEPYKFPWDYFEIDIIEKEENGQTHYQKYYVEVNDTIYVKDGKIYTVDDYWRR